MYNLEATIVHPLTLYLELSSTVFVLHLYRIQYLLFLHSAGPLPPSPLSYPLSKMCILTDGCSGVTIWPE